MCDHRLGLCSRTSSTKCLSSSAVHRPFVKFGFRTFCHRCQHCSGLRFSKWVAINFQFRPAYCCTSMRSFSSSFAVHPAIDEWCLRVTTGVMARGSCKTGLVVVVLVISLSEHAGPIDCFNRACRRLSSSAISAWVMSCCNARDNLRPFFKRDTPWLNALFVREVCGDKACNAAPRSFCSIVYMFLTVSMT